MISEVLRHRAYLLGAALLGSVGLASVISLLHQPTYESSMQILLEPNAGDPTISDSSTESRPPSPVDTDIAASTEIRIMRSDQFVEQAIASLEREQPDLCEDKEIRSDCIQDFKDRLTITQLKEGEVKTRVVEVAFTGTQKEQTFKFLLALQKLYRMYNVQQQQERIDSKLAMFDYELATGEQSLAQFLRDSHQSYPDNSSALPGASLLVSNSGQAKEIYRDSPYGKTTDRTETNREELYSTEDQTEPEKEAVIQLIHLRQEMANDLIQSGFTWELVEYPTTGRKVFPEPLRSLSIGRIVRD